jgi:hypothetical protein
MFLVSCVPHSMKNLCDLFPAPDNRSMENITNECERTPKRSYEYADARVNITEKSALQPMGAHRYLKASRRNYQGRQQGKKIISGGAKRGEIAPMNRLSVRQMRQGTNISGAIRQPIAHSKRSKHR